jgi:hypothetical protein
MINSVWFSDAVNFLVRAGWCPREELARVVTTRLSENNEKGARDFLKHDCGVDEEDLSEVLTVAKGWLNGDG